MRSEDPTPQENNPSELSTSNTTNDNSDTAARYTTGFLSGIPLVGAKESASSFLATVLRDDSIPHSARLLRTPSKVVNVDDGNQTWHTDPFALNFSTSTELLQSYLSHVNEGWYCIFPRTRFIQWLSNCRTKSRDERVLTYAILGMGSIFANGEHAAIGTQYVEIAMRMSLESIGRFTLPITQARLILGVYKHHQGASSIALDLWGLAINAVTALLLDREAECLNHASKRSRTNEYGMGCEQVSECCRRTFWACFLVGRCLGFSGHTVLSDNLASPDLRLPCADLLFESSMPSEAPFYDTLERTSTNPVFALTLAPMAWVVVFSGVSDDAMQANRRATSDDRGTQFDRYLKNRRTSEARLQHWISKLPAYLNYTRQNLERSFSENYAEMFAMIHVLHHFTLMQLNRCSRHAAAPSSVHNNIRAAHFHAHSLLDIASTLAHVGQHESLHGSRHRSRDTLTNPSIGFAILAAIDVASAGGPERILADVVTGIEGGLACLRGLAQYSSSALHQYRACERRLLQLRNIIIRPNKSRGGCWLGQEWGLEQPIEQTLKPELDCIYGVQDEIYFATWKAASVSSSKIA